MSHHVGLPVLLSPSSKGDAPTPGETCLACDGSAFWANRSGRSLGWQCCRCIPSPRPEDRIVVIDTKVAEPEELEFAD
jgi:hypothetical protein